MAAAPPDPDAALMLRAKRGDRAAFTELVERWKQPVMAFVYRTLPDADEAEDLAQATFVQLWKTAGRYEPNAKFSTFLFTIARNLCLNEIRRRVRHPADSLDEPASDDDEKQPHRQIEDRRQIAADDDTIRAELFAKVDEALRDLPEKQRTALVLCREGELSYEEIADVLGTSLQATKSLIHRAREALKARLKPYLGTGEWNKNPPRDAA
jgi:RNA polymerase sigma-70 factor, ECF subfamily